LGCTHVLPNDPRRRQRQNTPNLKALLQTKNMVMQKLHMDIEGMHCGACATGIQMVTEGVDGVQKVFVSYDAKNGDWEYDDEKTTKEAIVKEIEGLGYKAH